MKENLATKEIREALTEFANKRTKPKIGIFLTPDHCVYGTVKTVKQATVHIDQYDVYTNDLVGRLIICIVDIMYIDSYPVNIHRSSLEHMFQLENAPKTKDDDDDKAKVKV